ncbi:MAG: MarR family transcriptional regulator [Erythrobacter sp.]
MFFLKELPGRHMVEGYAARFDNVDPDTVLGALELMRSASLLIRELEAYFAGHDLSQLRFLTLILIDREPKRTSLTASEIAERLDVSRPVVTRTLKSLERSGLIAIASDEEDGRSKKVSLSAAGSATLEAVLPGYFAILHRRTSSSQEG